MLKSDLEAAVKKCLEETRNALQAVYDALNHGQKIQIAKDENVKALFDRYGVVTER